MASFKQTIALIAKKLFSRASFFWFVNLTFMAVSVLHAGLFFGLLEPATGLDGTAPYLGFAVALVLDLASIVFMQARLSALRMNERGSAAWYLFSIIVCSGLSAFGNLAMSLEDFKSASLSHVGGWIQGLSPWLGVAFPLLIILISIAADKMLDIDPTNKVSVEQYKMQQQRRIDILTERNGFLQKQTELERQEKGIRHPEKIQQNAQVPHVFFLKKWLFPIQQNAPLFQENLERFVEKITEEVMGEIARLLVQESQKARGEASREIGVQIARTLQSFLPEKTVPGPAYEHYQFPRESTMVILLPLACEEDAYSEYVSLPHHTFLSEMGETTQPSLSAFQTENTPDFSPAPTTIFRENLTMPREKNTRSTDPEISLVRTDPDGQSGRRTAMTFEEAAEYTGYTISYLKGQVSKGEIQLTQSGKIKVGTLKIKSGNTGKIPALKIAQ